MANRGVTLDLREGFDEDEVLVRADGLPDTPLAAVRTRLQTGRARSLPFPAGVRWLEVVLPQRGLSTRVELGAVRPWWVGVSLSGDGQRLEVLQQGEAFGYA